MKKLLFVVPALLLLATGCLKFQEELIIKDNGSGTLELNYSIAEQMITQIQAMNKLRETLDTQSASNTAQKVSLDWTKFLFDPQKDEIVAKLKEYEPLGIASEKVEIKSRDIRRDVNVKIRFNSLDSLVKTDFFREFGFAITKHPSGAYIFERAPAAGTEAVRPDFSNPETVRMISPLMSGFNVSLSISTPGRIIDTTGTTAGPYTTAWSYDYDQNPNALTALRNQRFRVAFDGTGLVLPQVPAPGAGGR
jgi:hypothetical protein